MRKKNTISRNRKYSWLTMVFVLLLMGGLVLQSQKTNAAILSTPSNNLGLLGYWSFEDGSGNIATDFSGNGNDGTLTNMEPPSEWVDGRVGIALDIEGDIDSEYLPISGTNNFDSLYNSGSGPISISLWVKTSTTAQKTIIDLEGWYNISVGGTTGKPGAFLDGSGNLHDADVLINDDQWHHLVVTSNGATMKIYVDGVEELSVSETIGDITSTSRSSAIGRKYNGFGSAFQGMLDEIRIYNRLLSLSEIEDLYGSGIVRFGTTPNLEGITGLLGHWSMDGSTISGTTLSDLSTQGNDGTISGSTEALGKVGQALLFDGIDDKVDIGDLGSGLQTVSFWVKPKSTNEKLINFSGSGGSSLLTDLISWYDLEEASGTRTDAHGTNDLSDNNTVGQAVGISGNAADFVAANSEYLNTTASDMELGDSDFTVASWVYLDSLGGSGNLIYEKGGDSSTLFKLRNVSELGQLEFTLGGTSLQIAGAFSTSTWYCVIARYDATGDTLSVDVRSDSAGSWTSSSTSHSGGMPAGSPDLVLGTDLFEGSAYSELDGRQDSWAMSSRRWSNSERDEFYKEGGGLSYSDISASGGSNIEISSGTLTTNGFTSPNIYVNGQQSTSVSAGEWQHVVITTATGTGASATTLGEIGGTYFAGWLDDVRLYDRELSSGEIQRIYNATKPSAINSSYENRLTDGLVGFWTFDGDDLDYSPSPAALEVLDVSGNNNHGDALGGAGPSLGIIGQGYTFDGGSWVRLSNGPELDITHPITITAWINLDSITSGNMNILAKRENNVGTNYYLRTSNTQLQYGFYNGNGWTEASGSASFVEDEWYFVGVTVTGSGDITLYKNGNILTTDTTNESPASSGSSAAIGSYDPDTAWEPFDGKIDNVRIYDRALDSQEVRQLYNFGQ